MRRSQGLKAFLAALCLSVAAMDVASAQVEADPAPAPPSETAVSPEAPAAADGSQPGWLLRGRTPGVGQNRIVNPFRATPAPGAGRIKNPVQPGTLAPSGAAAMGAGSQLPANAVSTEQGMVCAIGFRRQGTTCVAIQIPENGTIDLTGRGWMCNRGFQRQQQSCVPVVLPANASLDPTGHRWTCDHGFRRQAQACIAVAVPEHASLDKTGRTWVCDAGFQRREQSCIDDATARLQQQADKAVNSVANGKAPPRPSVSVNSGESRSGRTSKAKVVIGRF
jgi:hypothetical protein